MISVGNDNNRREALKNEQILILILLSYLVISLLISIFDLGSDAYSFYISNYISNIFPSINNICINNADYNSSKLIISISFLYIIIFALTIIIRSSMSDTNLDKYKHPFMSSLIVFVIMIICLLILRSDDFFVLKHRGLLRFIHSLVSISSFFVSIYGVIIISSIGSMCGVSILFLIVSIKRWQKRVF